MNVNFGNHIVACGDYDKMRKLASRLLPTIRKSSAILFLQNYGENGH
ncbi:MAG: hypothetical protein ACLT78_02890 [Escherichia coli]